MDIQSVSTPGGSTPSASIAELAQQHGVSRESLLEFVRSKIQQTQQENGEPPLDADALDQVLSRTIGHAESPEAQGAGYNSSARSIPARPDDAPRISVLA